MRLENLLIKLVIFCAVFGVFSLKPVALNAQNQEVIVVGDLCVFSEPESDAEVYIDGNFVGHTPFLKKVEVGNHELVVKKDMYYDHCETVSVGVSRIDVKVKLKPKFGMLKVNTKPMGASVLLNGDKISTLTPCLSGKILAGTLSVVVTLEDHYSVDTLVDIKEGKITNLDINMVARPTYISMSREMYDYQLNRVYNTNEDKNIVNTDTVGYQEIPAVSQESNTAKSNVHASKKIYEKTTIESGIQHGIWVKGGLGLSNVYGKGANGEKISWSTGDYYSVFPTFYFGAQYMARFNRFVGLAVDLNYSRSGYQYIYNDAVLNYSILNKLTFNGIELPVVARAYFFKNGLGPMVELGGIVNYRAKYKVEYTVSTGENDSKKENYGSFNWGIVGGLGCDFKIVNVACSANARVVMEMSKVFSDVNHKLIYFQFGIGVKVF